VKNKVAEKVRIERLKQNLSQQNMADELGITAAAYSNLERGVSDISITRLYEVSRILNRTPKWFVEDSDTEQDQLDSDFNQTSMKHDLGIIQKEIEFLKHQMTQLQKQIIKN
jgi:transcriptional regulator with XRE-family HTH domain